MGKACSKARIRRRSFFLEDMGCFKPRCRQDDRSQDWNLKKLSYVELNLSSFLNFAATKVSDPGVKLWVAGAVPGWTWSVGPQTGIPFEGQGRPSGADVVHDQQL